MSVMIKQQDDVSDFARIVDKLRLMDDKELRQVYLNLFKNELVKEWEDITRDMNFGDATDEDIVKAIEKKRYSKHEP
jgi:hypothetical protein